MPESSFAAASARLLLVSEAVEDHEIIRRMLRMAWWPVASVRTFSEAADRLQQMVSPVVLCDQYLPDGSWRDVLDYISVCSNAPLLIVASRLADDPLWAEVLNLGGFDVLAKPFNESEVQNVVASAFRQQHFHPRPAHVE
jgi:DNA-binding NtrC family response regulator